MYEARGVRFGDPKRSSAVPVAAARTARRAEVLLSAGSGLLAVAVIATSVTRFWRQRY